MRIAVIASNFIRLPPEKGYVPEGYSGAPELVAWQITDALVKAGHEVTLFASGDSKTTASLVSVTPFATSQFIRKSAEFFIDQEHILVAKVYQEAKTGKFDIIHSHLATRTAGYAGLVSVPTVVTIHCPLDGEGGRVLSHFKDSQHYVSISDYQRVPLPDLQYAATIYHGLNLWEYPAPHDKSMDAMFLGRAVAQKGIVDALMATKKLNIPIHLIVSTGKGNPDFTQKILQPLIEPPRVQEYGFIERKFLLELLSKSKVLLFPIKWEEPFGLVMIEAMACGTPVIAYSRGSVPEIMQDGETGFIVNESQENHRGNWIIKKYGVEGLIEALERIYKMSPEEYKKMSQAARAYVSRRFTIEKMAAGYEEVYKKIINHNSQITNHK